MRGQMKGETRGEECFECQSENGATALLYAYSYDFPEMVRFLLRQPKIDVNICESKGYSPLMWAADLGNSECVQEMMRHLELKINYHDGDGKTALIWAADRS